MVYIISFLDIKGRQYSNYFTIVKDKMDKVIVFKAIEENNKKFGYNLEIDRITVDKAKNIVYFKDNTDKCVIYKLDMNKEQEVKKSDSYDYISVDSQTVKFTRPKYISDKESNISFRRVTYDDTFCKCTFKVNDNIEIRYGESFNDGFNTSIENKRIQVRFSDGAIRFRDIDINNLK